MRNKLCFRFISFLSGIILILAAFMIALKPLSDMGILQLLHAMLVEWINNTLQSNGFILYFSIVTFVLLGISLIIAAVAIEDKKDFLISNTEYGEFIISTSAITDMVVNSVSKFEDIKTNRVRVSHKNNDIIVKTAVEISTASHLPSVVVMLQKAIKEHIEDCTGLHVKDIKIIIKNNNDTNLKVYKPLPQNEVHDVQIKVTDEIKETFVQTESNEADNTPNESTANEESADTI